MDLLLIASLLVALACTKRETQELTPWLRVHVLRPKTGDSGVIKLGTRAERYEVKRDGRWKKVGQGNYTAYMILGDETAALVNLADGQHLVRPDMPPRLVPSSLGRSGTVFVSADVRFIDVLTTASANRADIYRHGLDGKPVEHFEITIPEAYSDCPVGTVAGYGRTQTPYVKAHCKDKSTQAKCVFAGPDGFVHAVPPEADSLRCDNISVSGYSIAHPAPFQLFQ